MGREDATYGTGLINNQIVPIYMGQGFTPGNAVGPTYQGNGASPATIPTGVGGGGVANGAMQASSMPFSVTKSPVPLLLGMFVVGYLLLRYVHFRAD